MSVQGDLFMGSGPVVLFPSSNHHVRVLTFSQIMYVTGGVSEKGESVPFGGSAVQDCLSLNGYLWYEGSLQSSTCGADLLVLLLSSTVHVPAIMYVH